MAKNNFWKNLGSVLWNVSLPGSLVRGAKAIKSGDLKDWINTIFPKDWKATPKEQLQAIKDSPSFFDDPLGTIANNIKTSLGFLTKPKDTINDVLSPVTNESNLANESMVLNGDSTQMSQQYINQQMDKINSPGGQLQDVLGFGYAQALQNVNNLQLQQIQNAYNSPTEQMQRFSEAGLNPNLIYGQGSNGNMQTANAPTYENPFDRILTAFQINQQAQLNQAQVSNIEADTANKLINSNLLQAQIENTIETTNSVRANIKKLFGEIKLNYSKTLGQNILNKGYLLDNDNKAITNALTRLQVEGQSLENQRRHNELSLFQYQVANTLWDIKQKMLNYGLSEQEFDANKLLMESYRIANDQNKLNLEIDEKFKEKRTKVDLRGQRINNAVSITKGFKNIIESLNPFKL